MATDDQYEPAITDTVTNETGAESTITTRTPEAAAAPAIAAGESGDDPSKPPGTEPRGQRVVSDKTRAMFKNIAAASAKAEAAELAGVADDLVPMIADDPPPAAAVPAVAVPSPSVTPVGDAPVAAAAAPIPVTPRASAPPPVDVGKAAAEQARLLHEVREKALADREAALVEREKQLPNRADLIERPGAVLAAYLRDVYGASDDELKDVLTDVVTEISEHALAVKLPSDVKTALESRKAVRSVKAYKADLTRQQQQLVEQRAAQEKAATEAREAQETVQRERQAVQQVAQLLADPATRAAHKFLHDPQLIGEGADPAAIVIEVVKEQLKAGQKANWQTAARHADDYFKSQAEALAKRSAHLQSLLAPAPAAPAKAVASPGGAPGPAPKPQPTPANIVTPPPSESSDDPVQDRHERRAQGARRLIAKHFKGGAPTA